MRALGKSIHIYCPTGEPRGVRIAEITTRIVQAIVVPRAKLEEALARDELAGVGVYFLFGETDNGSGQQVYIGEAEDCGSRLREHHRKKDFWNIAVCVVSRTGSFTKAHCKWLEWHAIDRATIANRYQLANGNSGSRPTLPEWMEADAIEVFDTADVLLSTLGYPIFEPAVHGRVDEEKVFVCKRAGAEARGIYNEDGFVVLAGSIARDEVMQSAREVIESVRTELLAAGTLERTKAGLVFKANHAFPSPSAAASFVSGSSVNGWVEWRNSKGQTLDEVYRQ
jgi:hypothetical protein